MFEYSTAKDRDRSQPVDQSHLSKIPSIAVTCCLLPVACYLFPVSRCSLPDYPHRSIVVCCRCSEPPPGLTSKPRCGWCVLCDEVGRRQWPRWERARFVGRKLRGYEVSMIRIWFKTSLTNLCGHAPGTRQQAITKQREGSQAFAASKSASRFVRKWAMETKVWTSA